MRWVKLTEVGDLYDVNRSCSSHRVQMERRTTWSTARS